MLRLITLSVWVLWFPRNCRGLLRIKKIKNLMSSSASSASLSATATATFHNPYVQSWCRECLRCCAGYRLLLLQTHSERHIWHYSNSAKLILCEDIRFPGDRQNGKVGVIAGDLSCPNVNGVSRKVQKPLAGRTGPHTAYSSTWNGWPKLL